MTDLRRKIFDDFDIPETPKDFLASIICKQKDTCGANCNCQKTPIKKNIFSPPLKKKATEQHRSMPLNYRNYLGAAYKVFEEETLINIEAKQMKSHMGSMLDQCKQKQASQGDKLILRETEAPYWIMSP